MEPFLAECAKYGLIALSFGLLLWKTLQDKDRMAAEMNRDKRDLIEAYRKNTEAFLELKTALDNRPCFIADAHAQEKKR